MLIPDQPLPIKNTLPDIIDLVTEDLYKLEGVPLEVVSGIVSDALERKQVGIKRYGQPLKPFDGRNTYVDLYQEILDALNYMRKLLYETYPDTAPNTASKLDFMSQYKVLIRLAVWLKPFVTKSLDSAPTRTRA